MKRCNSCRTKAEAEADICPVCGIDQTRQRKDLTDEEKRIRRAARNIRFVAMLHLILAGILIMAMPELENRGAIAAIAMINLILAIGLIRFDYRAYKLAAVCYFGYGMVNVITVQLMQIPLVLLLLYVIGNKTAKAIFERRLPEA